MVKSERQASDEEEQETRRQASKCPGRAVDKHVMGKSGRHASDGEQQETSEGWRRARDMQERHATDRGGE